MLYILTHLKKLIIDNDVFGITYRTTDSDVFRCIQNKVMTHFCTFRTLRCFCVKVETIGDAYMVVCGAPEVTQEHAQRIANMAIDMIHASSQVISPASGKPLQVED